MELLHKLRRTLCEVSRPRSLWIRTGQNCKASRQTPNWHRTVRYLNRKTHKTLTDAILTCIWHLYVAVSPCTCRRQAFNQCLDMSFVYQTFWDTEDIGHGDDMGQVIMNSDYFGSTKIASCDKDFDASTSILCQRRCDIAAVTSTSTLETVHSALSGRHDNQAVTGKLAT